MSSAPSNGSTDPVAHCQQMWDAYCQSWAAAKPQRQQLLERCLTPTFVMTGGRSVERGYDDMHKQIDGFQARVPGAVFKTNGMKAHHSFGKVDWEAMDANGKTVLGGVDFLEFAEDGRIAKAVAFLN